MIMKRLCRFASLKDGSREKKKKKNKKKKRGKGEEAAPQ